MLIRKVIQSPPLNLVLLLIIFCILIIIIHAEISEMGLLLFMVLIWPLSQLLCFPKIVVILNGPILIWLGLPFPHVISIFFVECADFI